MGVENQPVAIEGVKKMETILHCVIDVSGKTLEEMTRALEISWVHPGVTEVFYPFRDSLLGKWKVEVQRFRKKEKFEEIVRTIKKDDWQPATIYHLLALLTSEEGKHLSGSFMAPGSLCIDDFEYPACVVLSINGEDKKIGLGNWRGSSVGGYDVVRVKRDQDILNSNEVKQ
jgi:hypothetical protein